MAGGRSGHIQAAKVARAMNTVTAMRSAVHARNTHSSESTVNRKRRVTASQASAAIFTPDIPQQQPETPVTPIDSGASQVIARLDAERRTLGCSQAELARMIGVSQSTISRLFKFARQEQSVMERKRINAHPPALAAADGLARIELALQLFNATSAAKHAVLPAARHRSGFQHHDYLRQSGPADRTAPASPVANYRLSVDTLDLSEADALNTMVNVPVRRHHPKRASVPTAGAAYRMLIAEDDRETVALYTTLFAEEDQRVRYEIDTAMTVPECLAKLRAASAGQPYDLLLMDLSLGDDLQGRAKNGLLRQLRRRLSLAPPVVLAVSGVSPYHLSARKADLAALGAVFIPKPFDIEELLQAVYALVTDDEATIARLYRF